MNGVNKSTKIFMRQKVNHFPKARCKNFFTLPRKLLSTLKLNKAKNSSND